MKNYLIICALLFSSYTSGQPYTNEHCNLFADAVLVFQKQRSIHVELTMDVISEYEKKIKDMLWDKGVDRGTANWISINAAFFSQDYLTVYNRGSIAHKWALSSCSWQLGKEY